MINIFEVKETNNMVEHENLDVRTITIGISLLSCIDSDLKKLNENIYNRITSVAKDLSLIHIYWYAVRQKKTNMDSSWNLRISPMHRSISMRLTRIC